MTAQFLTRIISQPWHISPTAGRTIIGQLVSSILKNERPEKSTSGRELPHMMIVDGVAIIPIVGTLMLNVPSWAKEYGLNLTDANDIADEYERAINDPSVEMIMLDVDSPGGESVAGEKLFDLAESASRRKPVFAHVGDGCMMCSSAYQASAPSVAIFTGKYSQIGSIGTYMAYLDDSAYWENFGLKWETFRSGELKGIDGALTPAQREHFEKLVAEYGDRFRSTVSKYRTEIDAADMNGASFRGVDGVAKGFAAGVVKDLSTAIAKARKLV